MKNLFLLLCAAAACNSTFAQVLEKSALDKIKDCDTAKYECDKPTKVTDAESIYPFFANIPKSKWPVRIVYSVKTKPVQQEIAYIVEETVITPTTRPDEIKSTAIKLVKPRDNTTANWEYVPK
jgi:hypothetical protein